MFKFPAWDVGGLTNFKQSIGAPANFDPANSVQWDSSSASVPSAWEKLYALAPFSEKATNERPRLREWLTSVQNLNWAPVTLRLHALAPEHRTVTSHDVLLKTGDYCERVFTGNVDDSYARKSTGESLYCGVTSKYTTPNLNVSNLQTEYEKCSPSQQEKKKIKQESIISTLRPFPWASSCPIFFMETRFFLGRRKLFAPRTPRTPCR